MTKLVANSTPAERGRGCVFADYTKYLYAGNRSVTSDKTLFVLCKSNPIKLFTKQGEKDEV